MKIGYKYNLIKDFEGLIWKGNTGRPYQTTVKIENGPYVCTSADNDYGMNQTQYSLLKDENNVTYMIYIRDYINFKSEEKEQIVFPDKYFGRTLFLAGGVVGDWRENVIESLNNGNYGGFKIINPYREDYPSDKEGLFEQTSWETDSIKSSNILACWFENSGSPQILSAMETIEKAYTNEETIIIGFENGYKYADDVMRKLIIKTGGNVEIVTNLNDFINIIKLKIDDYNERFMNRGN